MFDLERFIADCVSAASLDDSHRAVRELATRAVADPAPLVRALGEPTRAGVQTLYRSSELTILNLTWGPYMSLMPHNHNMWAVIALYGGREDNVFWRRLPGDSPSRIEAAGAKALGARDCVPLGRDIVHSVLNPLPRLTGGLHLYGGDFFAPGRSEWDSETLTEQPYDVEKIRRLFEESNARLAAA